MPFECGLLTAGKLAMKQYRLEAIPSNSDHPYGCSEK